MKKCDTRVWAFSIPEAVIAEEPTLNDAADLLAWLTVDDRSPWDKVRQADAFFRRAAIDIEPMIFEQNHSDCDNFLHGRLSSSSLA